MSRIQYIVNEPQAKAINDGASLLIVGIDKQPVQPSDEHYLDAYNKSNNWYWWTKDGRQNLSQCIKLPIKQGDEIFIAEEFAEEVEWCNCPWSCDCEEEYHLLYKSEFDFSQPYTNTLFPSSAKKLDEIDWQPASEMTEQQSRFKFKVGEVSVKRVQDTSINDWAGLSHKQMYEYEDAIDWLKDQGIDYSANPRVALAELKEV